MTHEEFYVGQRVKQKDPDEGYMCYGRIVEVKEKSIVVKWNDPELGELIAEHFEDEYDSIKNGVPST
jgi:ribosomal protein L35AE/L33A